MVSSHTLPYFRDPGQLPGPLPTLAEIEMATARLPTIRDPRFGRIVVVREHFMVKYGTHMLENEGFALLFLGEYSSIPAPRLYAMYRENGKLYLVMDFKLGRDLEGLWPDLSEEEKISILGQLRSIWDEMRSIPAQGFFGNVTGGPLQHRFFLWLESEPKITGTFEKEEDLDLALALRSQRNWESNQRRGWTSEFFARHLPVALKGHPSTFTHADLHRKNILIEELPVEGSAERQFRVSAIVDLETAGWYPSYWEYASCFVDFQRTEDWPEKVEYILDAWPLEAAMLRMVRQDLEF